MLHQGDLHRSNIYTSRTSENYSMKTVILNEWMRIISVAPKLVHLILNYVNNTGK